MLPPEKFRSLVRLARLDPEDEAINQAHKEFNTILEYIDRIQELAPLLVQEQSSSEEMQVEDLRPDEPRETLQSSTLARLAPEWAAGHFVVPGVIAVE